MVCDERDQGFLGYHMHCVTNLVTATSFVKIGVTNEIAFCRLPASAYWPLAVPIIIPHKRMLFAMRRVRIRNESWNLFRADV